MKVILVQLTHKAGEIGMLEHSWQDGFGKLVHILFSVSDDRGWQLHVTCLYDETVALRTPRDNVLE